MENALFHGALVDASRILYTPSEFARDQLIYLQEIGRLRARSPHTSARRDLSSYLFFCVTSGEGILSYQGKSYALQPGDCVFVDCRQPYSHQTSESLWSLSWVHFSGGSALGIYEKYLERGGQPCFRPEDQKPFTDLLAYLQQVAGSQDYIRDMRLHEGLTRLLTLLMEQSWHPEHQELDGKKKELASVKHYLQGHYTQKITLDDLSARFYINKYYLTRIFREYFGCSINQYLQELRITHAKELLRFSDKSMEEIGYECGIGAPYYFSRLFRKVEGISPSEYRKQW
ncbi:MAG: AraC family transcriptional regulator [Lachnospiraceae bacterium]|nr:helix-turn-helix domain-containing protein [Lachnospiraceae bacterium]MCR5427204.1 AraC family transcriptional regulator [Lachnospiraceae bacterium]